MNLGHCALHFTAHPAAAAAAGFKKLGNVIGVRCAQTECKLNLVLIKHTLQMTTTTESTNEMETQATSNKQQVRQCFQRCRAARSVLFFNSSKSKSIKGKTKRRQSLRRTAWPHRRPLNQSTTQAHTISRNASNASLIYPQTGLDRVFPPRWHGLSKHEDMTRTQVQSQRLFPSRLRNI